MLNRHGYRSAIMPALRSRALVTALVAIAFCGCVPTSAGSPSGPRASSNDNPIFDASGVWDGTSTATCSFSPLAFNSRCNAINQIALTMIQERAKISGFYKCSIGNTDCLNQNDSGTIASGSLKDGRLALRIGMPDGSSCIFNGLPTGANQLMGNYTCYQGGGLAEQGRFQVNRHY